MTEHLEEYEIEEALRGGKRIAYRLREVYDLTSIPVSTLQRMIRLGKINPVTSFGTWLITAKELEKLLNKRLR